MISTAIHANLLLLYLRFSFSPALPLSLTHCLLHSSSFQSWDYLVRSARSGESTKSSQFAIDDPISFYFLHHSDSPGLILVSQPSAGDNYSSWSRAMTIALSVTNKLGFIDGSVLKPDDDALQLLGSGIIIW